MMDLSTKEGRDLLRTCQSFTGWSRGDGPPLTIPGDTMKSLLDALDAAHARIERLEAEVTDAEAVAVWADAMKSDMQSVLTRFLEGRKG